MCEVPYHDSQIRERVDELFRNSDAKVHELMSAIIQAEHEQDSPPDARTAP